MCLYKKQTPVQSQRADQSSYNHKGVCYISFMFLVVSRIKELVLLFNEGKDKYFS